MLETINIKGKDDTPSVILDKENSIFLFEGISVPENSSKFYEPIISWIQDYRESPNELTSVTFKIKYYNSSSSLQIANIIRLLNNIFNDGHKVEITWYHHPQDDTIKEDGEEFADYFQLPVTCVPLVM